MWIILTVPGIILLILSILNEKKAEIVPATITEVIAQYRGSRYKVNINHDNMDITKVMSANANFITYATKQEITLYAIPTETGYRYKFREAYYAMPIVILFAGAFLAIMFTGLMNK